MFAVVEVSGDHVQVGILPANRVEHGTIRVGAGTTAERQCQAGRAIRKRGDESSVQLVELAVRFEHVPILGSRVELIGDEPDRQIGAFDEDRPRPLDLVAGGVCHHHAETGSGFSKHGGDRESVGVDGTRPRPLHERIRQFHGIRFGMGRSEEMVVDGGRPEPGDDEQQGGRDRQHGDLAQRLSALPVEPHHHGRNEEGDGQQHRRRRLVLQRGDDGDPGSGEGDDRRGDRHPSKAQHQPDSRAGQKRHLQRHEQVVGEGAALGISRQIAAQQSDQEHPDRDRQDRSSADPQDDIDSVRQFDDPATSTGLVHRSSSMKLSRTAAFISSRVIVTSRSPSSIESEEVASPSKSNSHHIHPPSNV